MSNSPTPNSPTSFTKILIANRGEIAVRVLRACREMGIATVAVFSEADADAPHVRLADEGVPIGPAPAGESYLQGENIITAARATGAQAIHPGYGFLAENAEFARDVIQAGLVFIGPTPDAIQAMGDKAAARQLMEQAAVPVIPGYQGEDDDTIVAQKAAEIGYPVLVKAAAGGGGKGMRIAQAPADLPEALAAARREALHAFGDARLILEKFISEARHIEFQILADQHGNTIHLNERECSVQRRHQKIIEETPSPLMTPELREEMGAAALAAARAVGYTNAGTVEFIVDPASRDYYFLEMNTRLQVEHPITELITGIDLVQWQIQIADGQPLSQNLISKRQSPRGHAIECRLYAEDPASGFLPASGRVLQFAAPNGPGIRVDAGIADNLEISTHYDPMLAKIIVQAPGRDAALRRMQTALRETVLLGLSTNLEFLQTVLTHPTFQAGQATTQFVEDQLGGWQPAGVPLEALIAAAASPDLFLAHKSAAPGIKSPWETLPNFRIGQGSSQSGFRSQQFTQTFTHDGRRYDLQLAPTPGGYTLSYQGEEHTLDGIETQPGGVRFRLNGRTRTLAVSSRHNDRWVAFQGRAYRFQKETRSRRLGRRGEDNPEGVLRAPMPGQVRAILVAVDDTVQKGTTLLLLEAMKMEMRIQAPCDGVVAKISVKVGDQVAKDQVLAEIK